MMILELKDTDSNKNFYTVGEGENDQNYEIVIELDLVMLDEMVDD